MKDHVVIHTGLFTERAFQILSGLAECMMKSKHVRYRILNNMSFLTQRSVEGETLLCFDTSYVPKDSSFPFLHNNDDEEIKRWFANLLKLISLQIASVDDTSEWNASSKMALAPMRFCTYIASTPMIDEVVFVRNVTIGEVYIIWAKLVNVIHLEDDNEISAAMREQIIGVRRDPIATETEIFRRSEVEKIVDKYKEIFRNNNEDRRYDDIRRDMMVEIRVLENKLSFK